MLDDFLVRAFLAGAGLALIAGPLGCFIIWRRMAYFGDTMAHSALLGVAMALLFELPMLVSVFTVAMLVSLALIGIQKRNALPSDTLLGILSHATLALGLVAVATMSWVRIDLLGLLFGDILAVTRTDIAVVYGMATAILAGLAFIWRPLLTATVSEDIATADGLDPARSRLIVMLMISGVIAIAMKIVGILLITALLIIPAATARRFSSSPEKMAFLAAIIGVFAVAGGIFGSVQLDTPSGPSIVVASLIMFLASLAPGSRATSGSPRTEGTK